MLRAGRSRRPLADAPLLPPFLAAVSQAARGVAAASWGAAGGAGPGSHATRREVGRRRRRSYAELGRGFTFRFYEAPRRGESGGGCVGSEESERSHDGERRGRLAGTCCVPAPRCREKPRLCGLSVPALPGAVREGAGLRAYCRNRLLAERVDDREPGSLKSWQNFFTLKGQQLLQ